MNSPCSPVTDRIAGPGARLLLIEDDASVARLTQLVLESEGYSVEVSNDHASASTLLARQRYDLVLADTELGDRTRTLDGLAQLAAIARATPVLLFSAHRFSSREIESAGLAGAIQKPYDIEDLLQKIIDALSGRSGHDPDVEPGD
jgi:two-component system, NtrC family, response regulator GlrR